MSKKQVVSLLILIVFLTIFFIYLIFYGTNFIVSLIVVLFLFLFIFGLIYKSNKISLSNVIFHSKPQTKSGRVISKEDYKIKKIDTPESLNFTYQRPLIRKCPNCGMLLTRNMKKCPNCQKKIE